MSQALGIVVAAGASSRFGGPVPKQFLDLAGVPVLAHAVRALADCEGIDGVIVVLAPEEIGGPRAAAARALAGVSAVVPGGSTRMLSSLAGAEAASSDVVLVHDAARPFASTALVLRVLEATRRHGAAVPAIPASETVKRDDGSGFVAETFDRAALRLAQTPQGARRDWLVAALRDAAAAGVEMTDEAQALERAGRRVALIAGEPGNVKLTRASDWSDLRPAGAGFDAGFRVGTGFDIHRFGGGGPLKLGGVVFPGEPGLDGHSDADVVLHAAMDAVLGAAGLGDIGRHFPPDDARYAGADSAMLARRVGAMLLERGLRLLNLDLTVLAERPRIGGSVETMREAIGSCFGVSAAQIGVKATTLEGLGALGRGEGIACQAVALCGRA